MGELGRIAGFLLPVIVPVFGLVLLGRTVVRTGLVDAAGTRGLTNLVFWFLLPALLFLSVATNPLPDGPWIAALYFGVALPLFALSVATGRLLRLSTAQAAIFGLNAIYGNTVLMGIPIVGAVWGGPGVTVLLAVVAGHSLILLPAASILVELGDGRRGGNIRSVLAGPVLASLKNPIILAIIGAVAWRVVGLPLPEALRRFLELLAQAAPALSLVCLGASLPPFGRASAGPVVIAATAIKLVLMPLCMAAAVAAAGLPMPAAAVLVVVAGMPTGANAFLLARRSEAMIESSAATVVIATLLAVVTLSASLAILR